MHYKINKAHKDLLSLGESIGNKHFTTAYTKIFPNISLVIALLLRYYSSCCVFANLSKCVIHF